MTPAVEFADGLGVRSVIAEKNGEALELLRITPEFALVPAFETALRERVGRLANFRHAYYARVRRVDKLEGGVGLGLVSERPVGARLSQVLAVAERFGLDLDINAALCIVRQLVPAVAMLHQNAREVAHGALAPERILVTAQARIVITDYVFGSAIEALNLPRERLWRDLQVAIPAGAGHPRLDQRVDMMQIGMIALALVLGRRLRKDDLRNVSDLVTDATETTVLGKQEPISNPLRRWLLRALQLDARAAFESAADAQQALDEVLSSEGGYVAAPIALETFLARYHECAAADDQSDPDGVDEDDDPEPEDEAARPPTPRIAAASHPPPAVHPPQAVTPAARAARIALPDPPARAGYTAAPEPPRHVPEQVEGTAALASAVPLPRAVSPVAEPVTQPAPRSMTPRPAPVPPAPSPTAPIPEPPADVAFVEPVAASVVAASTTSSRWRTIEHIALAVFLVATVAQAMFIWSRYVSAVVFPQGTLTVDTRPAGVQVLVDGKPSGATPLKVELSEGAHVIELRAGGEPRVLPITITAGMSHAQYVEMPNALVTGSLLIRSEPSGARVMVDGQLRGTTPVTVADLAAGNHELVVEGRGGRLRQTVQVQPGATMTINVPLSSSGGGGVATVAVGNEERAASGWVTIKAEFEMQVYDGSRLLGTTSIEAFELPPGRHELEVVSETLSFRTRVPVDVRPGGRSTVTVPLPKGTLQLTSDPAAAVWLDGARVGQTPLTLSVSLGPHEVIFRHPDFADQLHAVSVTAGSPTRLAASFPK